MGALFLKWDVCFCLRRYNERGLVVIFRPPSSFNPRTITSIRAHVASRKVGHRMPQGTKSVCRLPPLPRSFARHSLVEQRGTNISRELGQKVAWNVVDLLGENLRFKALGWCC